MCDLRAIALNVPLVLSCWRAVVDGGTRECAADDDDGSSS